MILKELMQISVYCNGIWYHKCLILYSSNIWYQDNDPVMKIDIKTDPLMKIDIKTMIL